MNNETFSALKHGATLITGNRRLASALHRDFARLAQEQGESVWVTPDILPWSAWLRRTLEQLPDESALPLSPLQSSFIWERIISRSRHGSELLHVTNAARAAQEAWEIVSSWRLATAGGKNETNEDTTAFAEWAREYVRTRDREKWVDPTRLPDLLVNAIREGKTRLPATMLFAGFDEFTPQQRALLETLDAAGSRCTVLAADESEAGVSRLALASADDEVLWAAAWTRDLLEKNVRARVAVVVPDLQARRAAIVRAFDEALIPEALLPGFSGPRPYNLSLGLALADFPVVHTALLILRLANDALEIEDIGVLLQSPFLAGGETERSRRALLDVALRDVGEPSVSLKRLLRTARTTDREGAPESHAAPILARHLEALTKLRQELHKRLLPSVWAEWISKLLQAVGWPGERALDSTEHQTVAALREALATLAVLDRIHGAVSYQDLLPLFQRILRETIFQPESPEAPVQVLGMLEASGLQFDGLWVMGLHDGAWPPSPRPNPFLPIQEQRRRGVPHASSEREYAYARTVTARLAASAPAVIFSHPSHEGDQDLRPSPLIVQYPNRDPASIGIGQPTRYADVIRAQAKTETRDDSQAPALAAASSVRTGTAVFRNQAACPFRAFATARLGASPLPTVTSGLDASARGNLVHVSLEKVWQKLSGHADLCALSDSGLEEIAGQAVSAAVKTAASIRPETFNDRFTALEQARLQRLILGWLQVEKQREPFTVVATERGEQLSVGGIDIKARIDRMDRLADGTFVIIDYKTGRPKVAAWFDERPDEPQLPLYSLAPNREISAVLFGQVRKGDQRFIGIAQRAGVAPDVEAYADSKLATMHGAWPEVFANWQRVLTGLGEAFRSGDARVNPKPGACDYCDLAVFCRIHEDGLMAPGETAREENNDVDA